VNATKNGGSDSPAEKKNWMITILDRYEEIANVKVASGEYMEYIQLVRQDGQWLIVNVLYTDNREVAD
jgi:Putative lumazine-binding